MYREDLVIQWAHAQSRCVPDYQWCKRRARARLLWRACSWDFTRVTVYLVVQMDLSRLKAVCCGQLTLHWTIDRWQAWLPSTEVSKSWHNSQTKPLIENLRLSKFLFYCVVSTMYSPASSSLQNFLQTDTHTHTHTHYRMLLGSAHKGITMSQN